MSNTLRRLKAYPGEGVMARNRYRGKRKTGPGQWGKFGLWEPGEVVLVKSQTYLEGPNVMTKYAYIAHHDWYFVKLDRKGRKGHIQLRYVPESDIQIIEKEPSCKNS